MGYYEYSIVVNDAEEEFGTVDTSSSISAIEHRLKRDYRADPSNHYEFYTIYHDHSREFEDCSCIEYLQSHKPDLELGARISI